MISNRLKFILGKIPCSQVVADIGTDHGYIAVELLKRGRAKKVIASDISAASLQKAVDLISRYGYQVRAKCRVGDGLKVLDKDEVDTVLIAGMGGISIAKILQEDYDIKFHKKKPLLILQPMQQVSELREYLYTHDFDILDEEIFEDSGKIYQLLVSKKKVDDKLDGDSAKRGYVLDLDDEVEKKYGSINLKKNTPLLKAYMRRDYEKTKDILKGINKNSTNQDKGKEKLQYLKRLEKIIDEIDNS